ncbi:hypothetical protein ACQJBY_047805 [Aegilops geniculata]
MTYKNHLAMKSLVQVFNEWEIQLLVLLSFMLQIFLFFTGSLRRSTTNKFLRLLIWIAYLGADSVAVYALGILSRREDATLGRDISIETHQLAFFWAPFFLIHLGGQDTVTAFAIEDNNLWLRHLLNLVIQVTLVLYIFWKSTSTNLLVPSILVFVTGTIKYGERTWALWRGSLKNLASSLVPFYAKQLEGPIHSGAGDVTSEVQRLEDNSAALYSDVVSFALHSIQGVRDVFAETGFYDHSLDHESLGFKVDPELLPKILEIELGLMFDDIYTKAMVLRTKGGILLRFMSLISFLASCVLFFVTSKQHGHYNSADIAITYALFTGGFFLEACAIFIAMMSTWTFAWLKARNSNSLAFNIIGWQRKRVLWPNSIGQYNLLNYLGKYAQKSSLCKRRVMAAIRKVVNAVCGGGKRLFISKLLDTRSVEVDQEIMRRVVQRVLQCQSVGSSMGEQWPKLGPLLHKLLSSFGGRFEEVIGRLHIYTEVVLSRYPSTETEESNKASHLVRVCRNMSDYMIYLLATQPEMLPVKKGSEDYLSASLEVFMTADRDDVILRRALDKLSEWDLPEPPPQCTEEQLVEILDAWIRLLVYAAGKSRPEMHAAQLARGGELLTFTWLLMAHHLLGDVGDRIEIADIFGMEEARIPTRARRIRYDEATNA